MTKTTTRKTHEHTADDTREMIRTLTEATKRPLQQDGFDQLIAAAATFHRYSPTNCALIAAQGAGSSAAIASYKKWQENGRQVRKGERAIRIWAPIPPRKLKAEELKESATLEDAAAKVAFSDSRPAFRLVPVFPYESTDPIPDHPHPFSVDDDPHAGTNADHLDALETIAARHGVTIRYTDYAGQMDAAGWYQPSANAITVCRHVDDAGTLRTLAHELGHALHYEVMRNDKREESYDHGEAVAEITAYAVARMFGIDSTDKSAAYVRYYGIAQQLEGPKCQQLHDDITATIRAIAKGLDEIHAEQDDDDESADA